MKIKSVLFQYICEVNLLLNSLESFERLFKNQYHNLVLSAYRIVYDKAFAEDIVQDVFLKLWQKKEEITVSENLPAYLHRAVVNHAINHQKTKYKRLVERRNEWDELLVSDIQNTDQSLLNQEFENKVDSAIASLPDAARTIFMLSRFETMTNKEIAEKLDISIKTVEKHMTTALKHLRKFLPIILLVKLFLNLG
jgi:RNA polymerase sigma-70 factor (ECF subfamily)